MAEWPYNTGQWKRLRRKQLARFPLCEDCLATGIVKVANHVDHRHAISDGGPAFPEVGEGLSSKCAPCHSAKTARGAEAGAAKTSRPRKGCSADGTPLDPSHPWNRPGGVSERQKGATCRSAREHSNSISFKRRARFG